MVRRAMRWMWRLAMALVLILALLPVSYLRSPVFDWWDKGQHVLAFAVLTSWALLLWPKAVRQVLLGMLAYGAAIEAAQWFIGWRYAEWTDLAADTLGIAIAWVVCSVSQKYGA